MKTGFFTLGESDRPALVQHLLRLNPQDRRLRFFHAADDAQIERFVATVRIDRLTGFFLHGRLVGSAMLMPDEPRTVEFAVTVDEELRGNGIASHLLSAGIDRVGEEEAERLVIHHLVENSAMAAVHRKYPSQRHLECGEVDVVIDLKALRDEQRQAIGWLCGAEG